MLQINGLSAKERKLFPTFFQHYFPLIPAK
jgi:hypothetical protein